MMMLNTRIGRLESRLGPPPGKVCPSCGVPLGWVPMWDAVGADGLSVLPSCPCGHPVDGKGRAIPALPPGRGQKHYGPRTAWEAV